MGFAYRASDSTVIRAGYGLSYDPLPFSRPLRGFYPLTINNVFNSANSYTPVSPIEQGIKPIQYPDLSSGVVPLGNNDMRSPYGGEIHRGYIQSWNFTVERKVAYRSRQYPALTSVRRRRTNSRIWILTLASRTPATLAARTRPQFGRTANTNMWDGYFSANYHSLQTTINKQFSKGLLIKGAYTYSKAINMTDDDGWAAVGWNWAPVFDRNRAAAGYDRTHVFQIGWVYELPVR